MITYRERKNWCLGTSEQKEAPGCRRRVLRLVRRRPRGSVGIRSRGGGRGKDFVAILNNCWDSDIYSQTCFKGMASLGSQDIIFSNLKGKSGSHPRGGSSWQGLELPQTFGGPLSPLRPHLHCSLKDTRTGLTRHQRACRERKPPGGGGIVPIAPAGYTRCSNYKQCVMVVGW